MKDWSDTRKPLYTAVFRTVFASKETIQVTVKDHQAPWITFIFIHQFTLSSVPGCICRTKNTFTIRNKFIKIKIMIIMVYIILQSDL